ncbi:hypothetical protein [Streptomyces sp. NBC_01803]|uniref:hypothetical protein n=1 Tax=Streptomyces sp. NBC_01803 TaxID=2975946 RepID=UPI002DD963B3|nr:hypothetical protein [Streptomyces sp. NBC_01803]WSA47300.1 hypothetical protein OIE51_25865 [Streptomyces sp. NBC_01803]
MTRPQSRVARDRWRASLAVPLSAVIHREAADDGSATYVQWTSLTDYAVVDEAKQQP